MEDQSYEPTAGQIDRFERISGRFKWQQKTKKREKEKNE
jgi:hypothetical protein